MKRIRLGAMLTAAVMLLSFVTGAASGGNALKSSSQMKPAWKMKNYTSYSSPSGYTPTQIKKAYSIDSTIGTGKGKTIAIVVAYGSPSLKSDLAAFDAKFGLTKPNLTIHDCGATTTDSDWALETSLDAEWAQVIAPDANLLIVEAASDDSDDLLNAVDYATNSGAQIVSMSWGCTESPFLIAEDDHFYHNNVVYLAATGDDGAQASWPASSPNVISVGGTTLKLDARGNRLSESAWMFSGGGTSVIEAAPSWQTQFGITSTTRSTPDVSFDADSTTGVSVYYSGGLNSDAWYVIGGTSLGAPAWAGIVADLNQSTAYIKNAGSLYVLAGTTGYKDPENCFNDITSGLDGFAVTAGYDAETGLGTPNGAELNKQTAADASALSAIANVQSIWAHSSQQTPSRNSRTRGPGRIRDIGPVWPER